MENTRSELRSAFVHYLLSFILLLYRDVTITRKCVVFIIQSLETLVCDIVIKLLATEITKVLIKHGVQRQIIDEIILTMKDIKYFFQDFNTEKKIDRYLIKKDLLVKPDYVCLGSKINAFTDIENLDKDKDYSAYIPLRETLKNFLKTPNIFKEILEYVHKLKNENEMIMNIIQCSLWKDKIKKFVVKLPYLFFFDDFEARNAMGTHAGANKFGGVYGKIDCLPPRLNSKVDSIQLISIFYSDDRKYFGNSVIFQRMIDDMNYLQDEGIEMSFNKNSYKIFFQCILPTGDNLGINSILGLTESFSASKFCRSCTISHYEAKYEIEENKKLIRNPVNYSEDLKKKNSKLTGIKEECPLHRIKGFHSTENICYDIMHDALEGVGNYDLRCIFYHLIYVDKVLTLDKLNFFIASFEYNRMDSANKPVEISADYLKQSNLLKLSAAESLNLISNLGLMIGDLVPTENKHWQLYVKLREILSILMSRRLHRSYGNILKILVEEHHAMYISLYGELKPKFHNITHYPRTFEKTGPFINNWGMRMESKNKTLKNIVESITNSRHLLVSMVERYQKRLCHLHHSGFQEETVTGHTIKNDPSIGLCFPNIKNNDEIESYSFIELDGFNYHEGEVYLINLIPEDDILQFGKLHRAYKHNGEFFFFMHYIESVTFDKHFQAYNVRVSDEPNILVPLKKIPFYTICTLKKINNLFYVNSRFKLS